MTRSIKLAVSAALALSATSALATNGDHLIGLGAKSRGMGGTAIGISHGAESGLSNAALITTVKGSEISFGGTLFMPKVAADMGAGSSDSAADLSMIPEVSIATRVNDNFFWGIGMWGTAGMGVDYRDESGYTSNMNMVTNLQLMQFGVPLAYANSGFSIGITPILQYGALDINYKTNLGHAQMDQTGAVVGPVGAESVGNGVAQDLAFGYNIGLAYQTSGITIGAVYKSAIEMEYKGQLSAATQPFVDGGIFPGAMADKLEQPSEMGVGASYEFSGNTVALDYKKINWSSAKGYEDFGWDDQNVISIGYQYATNDFALRVGYNRADNPISDAGAMTMAEAGAAAGGMPTPNYFGGNALNTFNLLGFPATVESHMTIGGTYNFSETMSLDLAYVYAPETTTKLLTMPDMTTGQDMYTEVTHSQSGVSFQLNYAFN
jgi:long-chain fatty acid transport protein